MKSLLQPARSLATGRPLIVGLMACVLAVVLVGCTVRSWPSHQRADLPHRLEPRPRRQQSIRARSLPADDAPHDRLTEWWYYTGHLRDARGGRYGFEFVVFRAERGGFP